MSTLVIEINKQNYQIIFYSFKRKAPFSIFNKMLCIYGPIAFATRSLLGGTVLSTDRLA